MRNLCIIYFLWILFVQSIFPQTEKSDSTIEHKPDTVAVRGVDWLAYPYIINSPENSFAFDGGEISLDINQAF